MQKTYVLLYVFLFAFLGTVVHAESFSRAVLQRILDPSLTKHLSASEFDNALTSTNEYEKSLSGNETVLFIFSSKLSGYDRFATIYILQKVIIISLHLLQGNSCASIIICRTDWRSSRYAIRR
jgi:hypothetical protein